MNQEQRTWNEITPPTGSPYFGAAEVEGETVVRRGIVTREDQTLAPAVDRPGESADQTLLMSLRRDRSVVLGYLVVADGERASAVFPLPEVTNLGRLGGDNDIILDDRRVSRRHARIRQQGAEFVLHDLASTNGTWVTDGKETRRIEAPHVLAEGDLIRFGDSRFLFMQVRADAE